MKTSENTQEESGYPEPADEKEASKWNAPLISCEAQI